MTIPGTHPADPLSLTEAMVSQNASRAGGKSFDQYLSAVEKRPEQQYDAKPAARGEQRPPVKKDRPERPETQERRPQPENTEPAAESKPAEKTVAAEKPAETTPANLTPETEEKIVAEIAQALNVSPEMVMQWLAAMNKTPADLTDPRVVVELLQQAFDAPTPAALLTKPAFPAAFEAVNVIVNENILKPGVSGAAVDLSPLAGLQVTEDESGQTVVTRQSEGQAQTQAQAPAQTAAAQTAVPEEDIEWELPAETIPSSTERSTPAAANTTAADGDGNPALAQGESQAGNEALPQSDDAVIPFAQMAENVSNARTTIAAARDITQPSTVNATNVMDQIMSRVRMQSGEAFSELRITLRPENLGDVTLRVMTQNGIVTAQFVAESERVKEVLESNFNQLRNALQEQGVNVAELYVSVNDGSNNDEERMNQYLRAQQNAMARRSRVINGINAAGEADAEEAPAIVQNGRVDVVI